MDKVSLLFGVITCLPAMALAHTSVADPAAMVPSVPYRSVFADTPAGVETESVDWKKANAEVGQFRNGHADILKWEATQAARQSGAALPLSMPMHAPAKSPESVKP